MHPMHAFLYTLQYCYYYCYIKQARPTVAHSFATSIRFIFLKQEHLPLFMFAPANNTITVY
jgi:hypothetical protein